MGLIDHLQKIELAEDTSHGDIYFWGRRHHIGSEYSAVFGLNNSADGRMLSYLLGNIGRKFSPEEVREITGTKRKGNPISILGELKLQINNSSSVYSLEATTRSDDSYVRLNKK